jgi:hypothetical protein
MLTMQELRVVVYCGMVLDAVPTLQANIQRGLAALEKALKDKTTVHRAMYRESLGWVDFVWGDEGGWPPNAKGRRKGEKGLSHVLEARPRKDGMTYEQTVALLRRMVRAIAEGDELDSFTVGKSSRIIVGKDGTEVHLVKLTGGNAWAMTVFAQR